MNHLNASSATHSPSTVRATARPAHTALVRSLVVCLGLGLCLASATQAAGRQSSRQGGTVHTQTTGPEGHTVSRDTTRTATETSGTVTGPAGQTATREVDRSAEETNATLTGPQGKTATRQSLRGTSGGSTTVTGPGGKTLNTQSSVQ